MNHNADNVLLEAIRGGDTTAFRALFMRYYDPLCHFACSITRQRESAEEAVSQVFEELWHGRLGLKVTVSLKAWLYGATRKRSISRIRSLARTRTVPIEDHHADQLAHHDSGRQHALHDEISDEVERLIATLPEQRQLIFRMNRIEGLRYREIADILGLSEHTVQNHMVLAVRQLAPAFPRLRELIRS